ncbi:MAG TPA: nuclear transport factor 2 family protein [Gemmatimonadaceae bacterium]|nr:nuclear transport factor 2 family protein [Gemmatimonadaceae bacterium]
MSTHADLIDRYIACWNETETDRRHALIAETFTPEASYVDPLMRGDGHQGLDALVQGVQQRFPGFRFALTRPVETVQDHVRFSWSLGPGEGPTLIEGTDFARVATDGRLAEIRGFLDRVPEGAA